MKKLIWIAVPVVVVLVVILLVTRSSKGGGGGGGRGANEGISIDYEDISSLEAIARTTRMASDDASLASIKAELMRRPMVDQGRVVSVEDSPGGGLVLVVDIDRVKVTLEIARAKMPAERPTVGQMISFTARITDIQTEPGIAVTVQNPTVGPAK